MREMGRRKAADICDIGGSIEDFVTRLSATTPEA
jgi:hypothetical protein